MLYVLNEWVFEDLLGENGDDRVSETRGFLKAFHGSGDGLVIPLEPRWSQKAYRLMTRADPRVRRISKLFHSLLRDSNRAVRHTPEDCPTISQELQQETPPEDLYLVMAYAATNADLLVTTDEKLHSALAQHAEINCQMRDEFLTAYPTGEFH